MSLPVGTLVMLVNTFEPMRFDGKTGEIAAPLMQRYLNGDLVECYAVLVSGKESKWPGDSRTPARTYGFLPSQVRPITPPGPVTDVTTDEPIRDEVTV